MATEYEMAYALLSELTQKEQGATGYNYASAFVRENGLMAIDDAQKCHLGDTLSHYQNMGQWLRTLNEDLSMGSRAHPSSDPVNASGYNAATSKVKILAEQANLHTSQAIVDALKKCGCMDKKDDLSHIPEAARGYVAAILLSEDAKKWEAAKRDPRALGAKLEYPRGMGKLPNA